MLDFYFAGALVMLGFATAIAWSQSDHTWREGFRAAIVGGVCAIGWPLLTVYVLTATVADRLLALRRL